MKPGPEREEALGDRYGDLQDFTLLSGDHSVGHLSFREHPFCCALQHLHGFRMVWGLGYDCELG